MLAAALGDASAEHGRARRTKAAVRGARQTVVPSEPVDPMLTPMTPTLRALSLAALTLACGGDDAALGDPPVPMRTEPGHASSRPAASFEGLEGFWTEAQARELLDRAERFEIAAETSSLNAGERRAVGRLLEAGAIVQRLYEDSRHAEATAVRTHLSTFEPTGADQTAQLGALRELYELF